MAPKENASEEKHSTVSSEDQPKSKKYLWYDWLSHPLLLLFVGAVISSFLIPDITRRWQDHQKELELKTALVNQITDATINPLAEAELIFTGSETQNQQRSEFINKTYWNWEIKGAEIGATLAAYFPEKPLLLQNWLQYYDTLRDYYLLITEPAKIDINGASALIRNYMFSHYHTTININRGIIDDISDQKLQYLFRIRMDEIIQDIIKSKIVTYN